MIEHNLKHQGIAFSFIFNELKDEPVCAIEFCPVNAFFSDFFDLSRPEIILFKIGDNFFVLTPYHRDIKVIVFKDFHIKPLYRGIF